LKPSIKEGNEGILVVVPSRQLSLPPSLPSLGSLEDGKQDNREKVMEKERRS
jgi:hypothetical protein